ncbi:MAG: phosphoribosylformimino-5-aminoimidazole carboxamide ribotide isomerase [Pirellulaceae bacterium]|jgi:phosphoribosylformimino-5-aminoimidazole carboxamide ribotide isomerase
MQVWPAIDLRGGKCVRLRQGDYNQETVFGDDPAQMSLRWLESGAERLHLVDLDGARDGTGANRDAVAAIVSAVGIPCELGGGIRDEDSIRTLLDLGLQQLVVGTKALKEPDWFREMCRKFPNRLAVGIDAKDGRVATDGWLEVSEVSAVDMARSFESEPVAAIIYTDIARDGMMAGPNLAAMKEMKNSVDLHVIASGGVTVVDDVASLREVGMDGCIIGRALYEETMTLSEAHAAASPG